MKNIFRLMLVLLCTGSFVFAEDAKTEKPRTAPLIDQLGGWIKKNNPLEKKAQTPEAKTKSPEVQTSDAPKVAPVAEAPAQQTPAAQVAEPQNFSLNQQRWHLSIGLGNLAIEGDSGSVIEHNYSPSAGAQLGVTYENPVSEVGSFETGLSFLLLSSNLKGSTNTDMNLTYLAIPLYYKHIVSQVRTKSSYYLKGGLAPLVLLDASVDTCASAACGLDSDLDAWLKKSRSVSDSFQKYSLLGTVGMGFNLHIFSDFVIETMWFNAEVSYVQGLTSINKGDELGKEVKISGVQVTLGLAATF